MSSEKLIKSETAAGGKIGGRVAEGLKERKSMRETEREGEREREKRSLWEWASWRIKTIIAIIIV